MAKRSISVGLDDPLGALDRKTVGGIRPMGVRTPNRKRRGKSPRKSRR